MLCKAVSKVGRDGREREVGYRPECKRVRVVQIPAEAVAGSDQIKSNQSNVSLMNNCQNAIVNNVEARTKKRKKLQEIRESVNNFLGTSYE